MKLRMTMATGLAVLALTVVSGCTGDDSEASPSPTPSTPSSTSPSTSATNPTPSVEPSTEGGIELIGDWEAPEATWVVHFEKDGTFTEDFEGNVDFRVGEYSVDGDTVSLIGDDGNTDEGTVKGETLVFRLGTLKRM